MEGNEFTLLHKKEVEGHEFTLLHKKESKPVLKVENCSGWKIMVSLLMSDLQILVICLSLIVQLWSVDKTKKRNDYFENIRFLWDSELDLLIWTKENMMLTGMECVYIQLVTEVCLVI